MFSRISWFLLATALVQFPRPAAAGGSSCSDAPAEFVDDAELLWQAVACAAPDRQTAGLDAKVIAEHCRELGPILQSYRQDYRDLVQSFVNDLLPPGRSSRVVYPFGGGDLVSALTVYPDADEITTLSLEMAGDPRRLRAAHSDELKKSLTTVRFLAKSLLTDEAFSRSDNLKAAQRGVVPSQLSMFVIGLAIHGYRPVSLRFFKLTRDGFVHYLTEEEIANEESKQAHRLKSTWIDPDFSEAFANMELVFRDANNPHGRLRVHRHIAANLADKFLREDPRVLLHLTNKGPVTTMTKAASYLLWMDTFSWVRNYLLMYTDYMISDSTGLPPRSAQAAGFAQTTFGDFYSAYLGFADAKTAVAFRQLWKAEPHRDLPFRFGYPDVHEKNHMMITEQVDDY